MKIDKAIKVLDDYKMQCAFEATPDFANALKLGIEALRRCELAKTKGVIWDNRPLSGETEE